MPVTDMLTIMRSILDPTEPFDIFFCVREIGRNYFEIGHQQSVPWHLIYIPEVGDLLLEIGEHQRVIEVGEVLWIQPHVIFNLRGLGKPGKINISVCRFDLDTDMPYRLEEDYVIGTTKPRDLLLNDLLPGNRIGPIKDSKAEEYRARGVIARLIGNAFYHNAEDRNSAGSGGLSAPVKKRCVDYIQQHIHEKIVIAEIANHVKLNPDYFARQFKKSFGVAPQTWIKQIRIQEAADHLLSGSSTITEIADQFGYNNVYFFSRQFREVMGISPKKWLKKQVDMR